MHCSELHIDGFGVFQDCSVRDLPNGLVVFSGENESGKSTLMQFFRMVLFGPPRGTKGNNAYPPLRGGQHGGRLELVMGDGRNVVVERIGKKVRISDGGGTVEQEPSEALLHGVDRQTYERVFAIGLEDLQGFDVLTQEGVRGRLLSAGTGLGAASVPETLKQLDRELEELIKPRGRTQLIPTLDKELASVQSEIRQLRSSSAEFARVGDERDQLQRELVTLRTDRETLSVRSRRLEQLDRARGVWIRLGQSKQELARHSHASSFPVDGVGRLEKLQGEIDELNGDRISVEEDVRRLAGQLEQVTVDSVLLECRREIEQLTAERQKLATAMAQLPDQRNEVQSCQTALVERLRDLGTNWDEERLDGVDTSVSVRHEVQQIDEKLSTARRDLNDAQHELKAAQQSHTQASDELEEARRRLDSVPQPAITDADELQRRRSAIRSAQTLLPRVRSREEALKAQQRVAADLAQRLERLGRQAAQSTGTLPSWLGIAVGVGGLLIAVVLAVLNQWPAAIALGIVGVLGAVAVFWLNQRLAGQSEQASQQRAEEIADVEQALKSARDEIGSFEQSLNDEMANLESLLVQLGTSLEAVGNGDQLAELESDVDRCVEQSRNRATWDERIEELQRAEKKAAQRVQEAKELSSKAMDAEQQLQAKWQAWLDDRSFDQSLRPDQFEVVLQAVDAARQARTALQSAESRLDVTAGYVTEVRDRVVHVCRQAHLELSSDEPGVETIDLLSRRLSVADEELRQQQALQREHGDAERAAEQMAQRLREKQAEKQKLLEQGGAGDDSEFRERAAAHETWKELNDQVRQDELEILTIAGSEASLEEIVAELAATEPLQIATEKEDAERKLTDCEEQLSNGERKLGELNKVLADMSVDDKLGERLQTERQLEERLKRATKRWAALAVCRSLLEKAREVYERERQPSVIQTADQFLKVMVNDRYRMIAALGEETVQVEAENKERKDQSFWSSGLADQVYLATRLGLACEFGKHAEPLPLIFDDVLVRFDATRRKAAARALLEVAAQQQVLLFSCHPEVVAAVQSEWDALESPQVPLACFTLADGQIRPMNGESPSQASLF
jgi:uncharacterized protein YhaN